MPGISTTLARSTIVPFQSLVKATGMDRAIGFTLFNYGVSALSVPLSIFLIARLFSPGVQGFYFTFSSILALQVVFELGFSQCITQFASHEFANLHFLSGNVLAGDADSLSRLSSLARLALKWYLLAAVLIFCVVGGGGYYFFNLGNSTGIVWVQPWILVCAATALNLMVIPCFSLLEGCNRVPWVAAVRCCASLFRVAVLCVAIISGTGLYALGLGVSAYLLVSCVALLIYFLPLFRQLFSGHSNVLLSWRHEIWPFQWKISLSWISGYFVFQLFNPVLFHFHGPVIAGRFGMTWALIQGISGVATAWGSTKIPRYGMLVKQRKFDELDTLWLGATMKSVIVSVLGGLALVAGTLMLRRSSHFGERLLDPLPTLFLVLATILNQVIFAEAFYLRSHKREPFVVLSLVGGFVVALFVYWTGSKYSAMGVSLSYLAVTAALLPCATAIFRHCRQAWHV